MTDEIKTDLQIPSGMDPVAICGHADGLLRLVQDSIDARITLRGDVIHIEGPKIEVDNAVAILDDMIKRAEVGSSLDEQYVKHALALVKTDALSPAALREDVLLTHGGRAIRAKTAGQKRYVDAIRANTITFGMGPAGTGKTYLAMAMAVGALKRKEVGRVVLSRPIVEAGESLGFLPGTLTEKVDPYIRPLYDALFDMTDPERANSMLDQGIVEIAPLAFMRGRTLNDSFVILDEAQNAAPEQMKMFLTRLGFGSKMVITADQTQTDLPGGCSGLLEARRVLSDVDDIVFCDLTGKDVVRNSLVAAIVAAYDKADKER